MKYNIVDAAIAELKAENKRMKEDLYKTDHHDIQYLCKMYGCDNVESFHGEIKNLQTKLIATERALWLARGYIMTLLSRDFQRLAYQCNNDDYKINLLRRRNRYSDLSEKCLKKAKECK